MTTCFLIAVACPATAAPIETYTARLSAQDHFNSSGERLETAAAIIRQDRASFFVYGSKDSEDEVAGFFDSKYDRSRLKSMLDHARSETRYFERQPVNPRADLRRLHQRSHRVQTEPQGLRLNGWP